MRGTEFTNVHSIASVAYSARNTTRIRKTTIGDTVPVGGEPPVVPFESLIE